MYLPRDFVTLLRGDATASNVESLDAADVFGAQLSDGWAGDVMEAWSDYIKCCPTHRLVHVQASGANLGAVLLLASLLHGRPINVSQVCNHRDIALIVRAKLISRPCHYGRQPCTFVVR
jgi:hypothetical protein